jgi:hypothetical protein
MERVATRADCKAKRAGLAGLAWARGRPRSVDLTLTRLPPHRVRRFATRVTDRLGRRRRDSERAACTLLIGIHRAKLQFTVVELPPLAITTLFP